MVYVYEITWAYPCLLQLLLLGSVSFAEGQSKLSFEPNLTLEEVQAENPNVHRGQYHPEECKAVQQVAIIIPHRNREKHLMYLLKHLHPFLQRQQLDYGIYVIHQVRGEDGAHLHSPDPSLSKGLGWWFILGKSIYPRGSSFIPECSFMVLNYGFFLELLFVGHQLSPPPFLRNI